MFIPPVVLGVNKEKSLEMEWGTTIYWGSLCEGQTPVEHDLNLGASVIHVEPG